MFYTLNSKTSGWAIYQADLDGSNNRSLVENGKELISPSGMTIDFPNQQLYWVDSAKDTIERIDINGKSLNRHTVTRVRDIVHFLFSCNGKVRVLLFSLLLVPTCIHLMSRWHREKFPNAK